MSDKRSLMKTPGTMMKSGFGYAATAMLIAACLCSSMAAELPAEAFSQLGDDDFKTRESAQAQLLEWGRKHTEEAPGLLFKQHHKATDPEVQIRSMEVLTQLAKDGYATQGRGFIGIQMREEIATLKDGKQVSAIRISHILPGLAAEKAGLKVGDLLVGMNGKHWPAPAIDNMRTEIMAMKPTTKVTLQVQRVDDIEDVEVTLVKRPVTADENPMLHRMPGGAEAMEKRIWEEYFRQWKEKHDPGA